MKKIIIIISILVVILGFILIIKITTTPEKEIIKYLESINFTNYKNTNLYSKQLSKKNIDEFNNDVKHNIESSYKIMYFNIETYELTKDKIDYKDGITKNITPTFNYKNNKITYNYRIYYKNTTILIEGTYDIKTEIFTCNPTYTYQINIEKSKESICNKVKLEIDNFAYEANTLIEDPKILKNVKENI